MSKQKPVDFWMLMTVLILIAFGTIMVFSASAPYAYNYMHGDTYHFLKKQLQYLPIGLLGMFVAMNFNYRKLAKYSPYFFVFSIVLLILVLIPGIGKVYNDSRRWFSIAGQSFQPSEFAKLAVILFFSHSLSKRKDQLKYFFKGLLPYLLLVGLIAALLLLEPHFSCTMIIVLVSAILLFCAGAKIKHFIFLSAPAVAGIVTLIAFVPYMRNRALSFLDPFADPKGQGWQAVQSLYAIGSGGLFGRGLGKSLQKFLYLPEPYNDFILSVLAEELGFIGVVMTMTLFLIFIWRGVKIAVNAPDMFGCLVAVGITSLVAVQVVINFAVVTSSVPVTGMPLPFFSFGGTSLIMLLTEVGILLNISRYSNYERI